MSAIFFKYGKSTKEPCTLNPKKHIARAILKIAEVRETAAYYAYVRISRTSKMTKEPCYMFFLTFVSHNIQYKRISLIHTLTPNGSKITN